MRVYIYIYFHALTVYIHTQIRPTNQFLNHSTGAMFLTSTQWSYILHMSYFVQHQCPMSSFWVEKKAAVYTNKMNMTLHLYPFFTWIMFSLHSGAALMWLPPSRGHLLLSPSFFHWSLEPRLPIWVWRVPCCCLRTPERGYVSSYLYKHGEYLLILSLLQLSDQILLRGFTLRMIRLFPSRRQILHKRSRKVYVTMV